MCVVEDIQLSRLNKRARRRRTVTRSAQRSGSGPLLDTAHRGPGRRRLGHRVRRCPVPLFGQHRGPGRRRLGHHPTPRILGQHRGPGRRRRLGHRVRRCPGPLLLPRTVTRRAPRTGGPRRWRQLGRHPTPPRPAPRSVTRSSRGPDREDGGDSAVASDAAPSRLLGRPPARTTFLTPKTAQVHLDPTRQLPK